MVGEHLEAFGRFRISRYSDRLRTDFDPHNGWPGARFIALHNSASLNQRPGGGGSGLPVSSSDLRLLR